MEDYRQTQKEYQRLQEEILKKRAAKAEELVRGVMRRMDRAPNPFRRARPRPIDRVRDLPEFRPGD